MRNYRGSREAFSHRIEQRGQGQQDQRVGENGRGDGNGESAVAGTLHDGRYLAAASSRQTFSGVIGISM